MKFRVMARGTRPLLMHNIQLASPLNKYAKLLKDYSSKRQKTDDDRLAIAKVEFHGSLYYDEHNGPYIPGTMLFANLIEGARVTKKGKTIERGVDVVELIHPLIYDGPRDMESLWQDSNFVDIRSVRVGQARVDRTRPIFNDWAVQFDLLCDPEIIDESTIRRVISDAGTLTGLGDYRKMYGRYTAEITRID